MTIVCITIDTEGDSANNPHSTFLGIEIVLPELLKLFFKHDIKATFFVQEDEICQVGSIFSILWKSMENQGHEIGYHAHGLIRASKDKKENIITEGIQKLRKLGFNPISFRGGRYHFNGSLLKILEKNGIKFDSSVVPGLRECFSDGIVRCDHINANHNAYFPSYENHCKEGKCRILELPVNRYPKLQSNRGGILTGGRKYEEVLFDYFYEVRKDKLIIIALHTWEGLSYIAKRVVRNEKYDGKTKQIVFKFAKNIFGSKFLTNIAYIMQFDNFLSYILKKNNVHFATIKAAGESIVASKLE